MTSTVQASKTWVSRRAKYLFSEVNERGHDLPLASVTKDGGVEFRSDLSISVWNPGDDVSGYKRVQVGDFVIGLRSFQSGIGFSPLEGLVSPAYTVLRANSQLVYRPFFKHLFKSDVFISRLENIAQGIRQGRTISTDDFMEFMIDVPPVVTQRAIADYLDAETARIDALIEKKQRMAELMTLRWRSLLVQKMVPHVDGEGNAEVVPDGWRSGHLRNLVDRVVGGSWGDDADVSDVNVECVRAADFDFLKLQATTGAIRSFRATEIESRVVREGDLVIEKSGGGDEAPVGRVVQWRSSSRGVPTNFAARLRTTPGNDPLYVLFCFRAAYELGLNWKSIKQTTGIQNLDTTAYLSEPWAVPGLDDQLRIARELQVALNSAIRATGLLHSQIDLLREHRQALITAAITGELKIEGVTA